MERFTFFCCQCRTYRCEPKPKDGIWRLPRGWWFAERVSEEFPCVWGHEHTEVHQPIYCPTCRPVEPQPTPPEGFFWRWSRLPEANRKPGARLCLRHPKTRSWIHGTYLNQDPDQWGWHWVRDDEGNSWLVSSRELYVPDEFL